MSKRILIVDDEPAMLSAMRRDLRHLTHKYDLCFAKNGKEALKAFSSSQIDLLITDIFMPEIEGIGLITEVRHKYPDTKIIAMSGGGSQDNFQYLDFAKKMVRPRH